MQMSSLLRLMTRTDRAVKDNHIPRSSVSAPLSGTANMLDRPKTRCARCRLVLMVSRRRQFHGRYCAERELLSNQSHQGVESDPGGCIRVAQVAVDEVEQRVEALDRGGHVPGGRRAPAVVDVTSPRPVRSASESTDPRKPVNRNVAAP